MAGLRAALGLALLGSIATATVWTAGCFAYEFGWALGRVI